MQLSCHKPMIHLSPLNHLSYMTNLNPRKPGYKLGLDTPLCLALNPDTHIPLYPPENYEHKRLKL